MPAQQPDDLKALGDKIEEAGRKRLEEAPASPPSSMGIAFRFATEMVAGVVVGGTMGWGLDWAVAHWSPWHTRPAGMVVLTILGAAAGVRNVLAAARDINAEMAFKDGEK